MYLPAEQAGLVQRGAKNISLLSFVRIVPSWHFYRIFFIYPRFELETQVESRLVFRSFDS